MTPILSAAAEIQDYCQSRGWRFCIVGGLAVLRWGKPRTTQDVDITLITGFGNEESFVVTLLQNFAARHDEAKDFALRNRVLLLRTCNGIGIDVALGGFPFELRLVERATPFEFQPGLSLVTASAEDLIVMKAFAGRPQDWADIEGILRVQNELEWDHVTEQLAPLCDLKDSPETISRLLELRDRIHGD